METRALSVLLNSILQVFIRLAQDIKSNQEIATYQVVHLQITHHHNVYIPYLFRKLISLKSFCSVIKTIMFQLF